MSNWDFTVFTGNPEVDRNTALAYQQQAQQQGLQIDIQPLPTGGYRVRAWAAAPVQQQQAPQAAWGQPQTPAQPAPWGAPQTPPQQAPQAAWGQPQAQAQGAAWGQPQAQAAPQSWGGQQSAGGYAAQQSAPGFAGAQSASPPFANPMSGGAAAMAAGGFGAAAVAGDTTLDARRVAYLRKVYGLLTGSALFAILAGMASITLGPTQFASVNGVNCDVPIVVATLLGTPFMWGIAFALLFGATIVAGWVSKVKGLNVIALFGVAALMGVELAPMVFVANLMAGAGQTMTTTPVRDAFIMVGAVFVGITTYIFLTKKDFSYLRATLSMGFFVIFAASILAMFMGSEAFSLAVATAGSMLSAGFLLYVTSYIFRNSEMDDPVGDALALLVQLRNLFMFILRIFMSSRD